MHIQNPNTSVRCIIAALSLPSCAFSDGFSIQIGHGVLIRFLQRQLWQ